MNRGRHRWLIPLAALAAVLPMLLHGASCGHDFDFHLLSWLEAQTQLAHGAWPQWAYTPAWNAGEPRFLFYPPLSWLLGAALTTVLPFQYVPVAFTYLALTASGFSMNRLAAHFAPANAACLAGVLYLLNPYMLFTAYERTAYGELLAAVFLPLLFTAVLSERPRITAIAVPVALLWLTNAPAAVMGSYALAVLTVGRLAVCPLVVRSDRRVAITLAISSAGGMALGLALAAFYIIPAAFQRRFVQISMAVIPGMSPRDNFLFRHTADAPHDAVLHTASLLACLLLAVTALALTACWRRSSRAIVAPVALLTGLIGLMLTPLSAPLWRVLPELAFLQFPWRMLALLTVVAGLGIALALSRWSSLQPLWLLPVAALLIVPCWLNFQQGCDAGDAPLERATAFHSTAGTEPTDEYTPLEADGDALKPGDPPYWLVDDLTHAAAPANSSPGPMPRRLILKLPRPEYLVLNRRQYPAWQTLLNGRQVTPLNGSRDDGLLTLALPAGTDTVELRLLRTPDEWAGIVLSSLAALLLWLLTRRSFTLG